MAMNPELGQAVQAISDCTRVARERPQKGRYREFYQCDADIVGTSSMLADAEIIAMIFAVLSESGLRNFRPTQQSQGVDCGR